jgi:hypothetical protein
MRVLIHAEGEAAPVITLDVDERGKLGSIETPQDSKAHATFLDAVNASGHTIDALYFDVEEPELRMAAAMAWAQLDAFTIHLCSAGLDGDSRACETIAIWLMVQWWKQGEKA